MEGCSFENRRTLVARVGSFVHGFQRPCPLWFLESVDFPMLEWEGDELKGVKPDFVRHVVRMLGEAKREQLRIHMSHFDNEFWRAVHEASRFLSQGRAASRNIPGL